MGLAPGDGGDPASRMQDVQANAGYSCRYDHQVRDKKLFSALFPTYHFSSHRQLF